MRALRFETNVIQDYQLLTVQKGKKIISQH